MEKTMHEFQNSFQKQSQKFGKNPNSMNRRLWLRVLGYQAAPKRTEVLNALTRKEHQEALLGEKMKDQCVSYTTVSI